MRSRVFPVTEGMGYAPSVFCRIPSDTEGGGARSEVDMACHLPRSLRVLAERGGSGGDLVAR